MLSNFMQEHNLPEDFRHTAQSYYIPLADTLYERHKEASNTYFVGINGCQGSGKSTLTDFIHTYLKEVRKLNVVVMSLDDFYFSSEKRQQLAKNIHPLLATRGVPGTHNIEALKQVLKQLIQKQHVCIPRFNKATDEPFPQTHWQNITQPADIVLIEGWCWGVPPQNEEQLIEPVNELELQYDTNGVWRRYANKQLANFYQPLYQKMDFWLALQSPSFDCVYQWRLEQEQKLAKKSQGLTGSKVMTPDQVLNFTQYFQRLSVQGCQTISHSADLTFYLDYNRKIFKETSLESA